MKHNKTVREIKNLLEENDVEFKFFEHEPVRTSEEAARVRPDYELKQGAKAMIVRHKPKASGPSFAPQDGASEGEHFAMLVLPGDKRFDGKKVKKALNAKDVTFASEDEVIKLTDGVIPGGVPPFGNLFDLKVLVDPSLLENDEIIFNCGDQSASIAMRSEDWKKFVQPQIEDIV
jgi:Ala-tRNA(Pro) deacylase